MITLQHFVDLDYKRIVATIDKNKNLHVKRRLSPNVLGSGSFEYAGSFLMHCNDAKNALTYAPVPDRLHPSYQRLPFS